MSVSLIRADSPADNVPILDSDHARQLRELLFNVCNGIDGDSEITRQAWRIFTGDVPDAIETLIPRHGFFDSALALCDYVVGPTQLVGWSIEYNSRGGPYRGCLIVRDPNGAADIEFVETSNISAASALIGALVQVIR